MSIIFGNVDALKLIVSAAGTVVAAAGLGWRVFTWRRKRSTRVQISVKNVFPTYHDGLGSQRMGDEWWFGITAVNRGDHPVNITSGGFRLQDGSGRTYAIITPGFGSDLPGVVAPHGAGTMYTDADALADAGLDVYGPIVAFVRTAADEEFDSPPTHLRSR